MREYNELLLERLRNSEEAQGYLEAALEEFIQNNAKSNFLEALRAIILAQGGVIKLSKKLGISREAVYAALSPKGNQTLDTFVSIIKGLGFKISIKLAKSV